MTKIGKLKDSFLWLFRWIIYPPILYFVIYFIGIYNQNFLGTLVWHRGWITKMMTGEATTEEYNAAIPPHPDPHHPEDDQ